MTYSIPTDSSVRVRFAPSPTGNVHIGNIRAAIFNYLFARNVGGKFLLRVEDTDLERSTPEAVRILFETMEWLGLNYDEEPVYQSKQIETHTAAAKTIEARGLAVRAEKGEAGSPPPLIFCIPYQLDDAPFIRETGPKSIDLHPSSEVSASLVGVAYQTTTKKGAPFDQLNALGGFKGLTVKNATGDVLFRIEDALDAIRSGQTVRIPNAARLEYIGRDIVYSDLIKGDSVKPLDSMSSFVIVRGDGSPVFHLANVVDDVSMRITHILRGDDHVENTYKHLFIYYALGKTPPRFGHLPMLVNDAGKKLSKRDGDSEVAQFREKGYLPETLFNFLALMGWSPGDDREQMTRDELISAFSLDRIRSTPAQMNYKKLDWLNSRYIASRPLADIAAMVKPSLTAAGVDLKAHDPIWLDALIDIMRLRVRALSEFPAATAYYFSTQPLSPDMDNKNVRKTLTKDTAKTALAAARDALSGSPKDAFSSRSAEPFATLAAFYETLVNRVSETSGVPIGDVAQPLRIALTGGVVSPPIGETLALIGTKTAVMRIDGLISAISQPG